jgi:hypothetical protein
MERYLKVYLLIEKVWVVHSKPQVKAQRAIIASVSRAALQSHRNSLKSYEVEFLIDQQEDRQQIARLSDSFGRTPHCGVSDVTDFWSQDAQPYQRTVSTWQK